MSEIFGFGSQAPGNIVLLLAISLWQLLWKGLALWRAAGSRQRNWFIAILILNTFGILEIVYLFRFSKKRLTISEIQSWLSR